LKKRADILPKGLIIFSKNATNYQKLRHASPLYRQSYTHCTNYYTYLFKLLGHNGLIDNLGQATIVVSTIN